MTYLILLQKRKNYLSAENKKIKGTSREIFISYDLTGRIR